MSGQMLGNGGTAAYTFNARALQTQLVNKDGSGNILSSFSSMTYDGVGNRTAATVSEPSYSNYSGSTSFAYDNRDELTNETSTRNGGYNNGFYYDGAENPTTFRNVTGKTYNSDNQSSSTGYTFDGNGNPTTYSSNAAVFDVENRLKSYGSLLTAGYDSFNIRAWKTDSSGTTYYLYDNDSTSPVCELSSSGTVTATNTYTMNGLVSRNTSAGSTFNEFDQSGTVAERLNSAGTCTMSSLADATGAMANSGTVNDPFGYVAQAGYLTDSATGLVLTTFRYYDPAGGRFINRDPTGYAGGVELYGYTQNGWEDRVDPLGLDYLSGPGYPGEFGGSIGVRHSRGPCPSAPKPPCEPNKDLDEIIGGAITGLMGLFFIWLDATAPELLLTPIIGCIQGAMAAWEGSVITNMLDNCGDPPTADQVKWDIVGAAVGCGIGGAGAWLNIKFAPRPKPWN